MDIDDVSDGNKKTMLDAMSQTKKDIKTICRDISDKIKNSGFVDRFKDYYKYKKGELAYASFVGVFALGSLYMASFGAAYVDWPIFDSRLKSGRTKNGVAAVVSGIMAKQYHEWGQASDNELQKVTLDAKVKKVCYPDAEIEGDVRKGGRVYSDVDLWITSSTFSASPVKKGKEEYLNGSVAKSEFNWKIEQTGHDRYLIRRKGWKNNAELVFDVHNGVIEGKYIRHGMHFDWKIKGTYDNWGRFEMDIDHPLVLGIKVEGDCKTQYKQSQQ